MTDDLVQFVRDRLDEDVHQARRAAELQAADWACPSTGVVDLGDDLLSTGDRDVAYHIARHDPARVLADIAAKRQIVEKYERALENCRAHPDDLASSGALLALHGVVRVLALPYADHPDYRQE